MAIHYNPRISAENLLESIDVKNIKSYSGGSQINSLTSSRKYEPSAIPINGFIEANGSLRICSDSPINSANSRQITVELVASLSAQDKGTMIELKSLQNGFAASNNVSFYYGSDLPFYALGSYSNSVSFAASPIFQSYTPSADLIELTSTNVSVNFTSSSITTTVLPNKNSEALSEQQVSTTFLSTQQSFINNPNTIQTMVTGYEMFSTNDRSSIWIKKVSGGIEIFVVSNGTARQFFVAYETELTSIIHLVIRSGISVKNLSVYGDSALIFESDSSDAIIDFGDMIMTIFSNYSSSEYADGIGLSSISIYGRELSEEEIYKNNQTLMQLV